mmetsp:Transcript_109878/g.291782  ORF Transcript_109878/g.291782 Transcript_109878/m.291782 type:complete len:91 (+) Transcript_109878:364-636(+)
MPFEAYVTQHILEPLGMASTGFTLPDAAAASAAAASTGGARIPWYDLGWNAPAGQMYSTLGDMGRFYGSPLRRVAADTSATRKRGPTLRR